MSWGDPMDKFYKDPEERVKELAKKGIVPGAMVQLGHPDLKGDRHIHMWKDPSWDADTFGVSNGVASIITVDCQSDPIEDWVFLIISTAEKNVFGWAPVGTLKLAG